MKDTNFQLHSMYPYTLANQTLTKTAGHCYCFPSSHTHTHTNYLQYLLYLDQPLYLGSQGPGSRWFPAVAPGSLSLRWPAQAVCSPWCESSVPDLHKTESRCSRSSRVTDRHRLGNAPGNSSTCHVHSHYRGQRGE